MTYTMEEKLRKDFVKLYGREPSMLEFQQFEKNRVGNLGGFYGSKSRIKGDSWLKSYKKTRRFNDNTRLSNNVS